MTQLEIRDASANYHVHVLFLLIEAAATLFNIGSVGRIRSFYAKLERANQVVSAVAIEIFAPRPTIRTALDFHRNATEVDMFIDTHPVAKALR